MFCEENIRAWPKCRCPLALEPHRVQEPLVRPHKSAAISRLMSCACLSCVSSVAAARPRALNPRLPKSVLRPQSVLLRVMAQRSPPAMTRVPSTPPSLHRSRGSSSVSSSLASSRSSCTLRTARHIWSDPSSALRGRARQTRGRRAAHDQIPAKPARQPIRRHHRLVPSILLDR